MSFQTNGNGPFTSLSRHDVYYINGGDLYFLVQTVTFRVHRYFFERESPRFKGLLSAPASPGAQRQGTSDSNAIVLDNVAPEEFAKFLWVFYNPRYSLYHATPDDWTTILDLSWRWQFGEVKALAVRELEKLTMEDVDRIAVYHNFEVDRNLLIPRYAALCAREDPLSLEEGMKLGLETALLIARTREHARAQANPAKGGARSPSASNVSESEMETLVRQLFAIKPSENYESGFSPVTENSNTNSSFTAAGQAVAAAPKTPAKPASKKSANGKANGALNGSNNPFDINSPPRAKSPAPTTSRAQSPPPAQPQLAPLLTESLIDAPTPTAPNDNVDAAATTAPAPPVEGQATTESESKVNSDEEGKTEQQPEGEASAAAKSSAANEEENPGSRSASPTRGAWGRKAGGKRK